MLINLSNHPLKSWSENQRRLAEQQFGEIIDLDFPAIAPEAELEEVMQLAEQYAGKCSALLAKYHHLFGTDSFLSSRQLIDAVHVMGEMTFVYQFVHKMSEQGVLCVASTTRRIATDNPDGSKISQFEFVRFRPYSIELF